MPPPAPQREPLRCRACNAKLHPSDDLDYPPERRIATTRQRYENWSRVKRRLGFCLRCYRGQQSADAVVRGQWLLRWAKRSLKTRDESDIKYVGWLFKLEAEYEEDERRDHRG
jgi:hypothetical protein